VERNLTKSANEENTVCKTCGEEFEDPLLTEFHSGSVIIDEYYACPRCLTKVGEVEHERKVDMDEAFEEEAEAPLEVEEEPPNVEISKTEETQACPHYQGYLKKRPKGTPIPEGCLTCTKMIDCI
jgi:DNA-directed RNA polymerase subunit RPC12/RpoP